MSVKTKQKLLKLREGPKICRRKLNFDNYTKNVKKRGGRVKICRRTSTPSKKTNTVKTKGRPKIMSKKIEF